MKPITSFILIAAILATVTFSIPNVSGATLDQDLAPPRVVSVNVRNVTIDGNGFLNANLWVNFTESPSASVDTYLPGIVFHLPGTPERGLSQITSPITTRPGWLATENSLDAGSQISLSRGNWSATANIAVKGGNFTEQTVGFESCNVVIAFVNGTDDDAFCGYDIKPPPSFGAFGLVRDANAFERAQVNVSFWWRVSPDDPDQENGTGFNYFLIARELNADTGQVSGKIRRYGPLPSTPTVDGDGRRIFNLTNIGTDYGRNVNWAMIAVDPILNVFSPPTCELVLSDRIFLNRQITATQFLIDLVFQPDFRDGLSVPVRTDMEFCGDDDLLPESWRERGAADGLLNPDGPQFPLIDMGTASAAVGLSIENLGYILAATIIGGAAVMGLAFGGALGVGIASTIGVVLAALLGLVPPWLLMVIFAGAAFIVINPADFRREG